MYCEFKTKEKLLAYYPPTMNKISWFGTKGIILNDAWIINLRKNLKENKWKKLMFWKKNKKKIKELEEKLNQLEKSFEYSTIRERNLNQIIKELIKRNDLLSTHYWTEGKDREETQKTYELLIEQDGWQLWSKRKK